MAESDAGNNVHCPDCGARIFVPNAESEETIPLRLADSEGRRLPVVDAGRTSGETDNQPAAPGVPSASSEAGNEGSIRLREDSDVPRLPVIQAPVAAAADDDNSAGGDSAHDSDDGAISIRQPELETRALPGLMVDLVTSEDNRQWRKERQKKQAAEAEQRAVLRTGILSGVVSMLLVVSIGLPFVLSMEPEPVSQPGADAHSEQEAEPSETSSTFSESASSDAVEDEQ